jgi:hypothetical protein
MEEETEGGEKGLMSSFVICTHQMVGWVIKSQRKISWMGRMACLRGKDIGREPEGMRPLGGRMV